MQKMEPGGRYDTTAMPHLFDSVSLQGEGLGFSSEVIDLSCQDDIFSV